MRDHRLAHLATVNGLPPLWGRRPGFASLVQIILEQQVSLAAARTLTRRLRDSLGTITPATVGRAGEGHLRRLGVTRQKASYCVGAARQMLDGRLSLAGLAELGDDAVREHLTVIRGIGPWSAEVYLLMALRRPDVWPTGDLALLNSARQVLWKGDALDQARLAKIALRWRPYRAIAARMLWHDYLRRLGRSPRGRAVA